jgi:thiol:disulfide interchange protein DsbC
MKMPKPILIPCALLVLIIAAPLPAATQKAATPEAATQKAATPEATPEDLFRKSFPNIPVQSMTPTAIPGVYEVVSGGRVAYYAPGPDYLIMGSLITREGKNLTEERGRELLSRKLKEIPLDRALKIGNGPHTVIEITDPDCPYCRQASAYLAKRTDLTRHIFFMPLAIHKDAEAKVRYIFCAPDKIKAYEEAMAGKLDDMKFKTCQDAEAEDLLKAHRDITARVGVQSTPMFLIDGQVVNGADIPLMERILGAKK